MKYLLMILALTLPLTACGHKGKLKSPEQIEAEAAKKSKDAAEAKDGKATEEKEETINVSPPDLKPQAGGNLNESRPLSPSVGNSIGNY